jgi:GntR family transcriptional regulator
MAGPPLYRQIAEDLRSQIESRELSPETKLPTEDELMGRYEASRNTVRGAIKELATRGLVHTLQGKGTFVADQPSPIVTTLTTDPKTGSGGGEGLVYTAEVEASGRRASTSKPKVEIQEASPAIAAALHIPEGAAVISRHQKRFVDDLPWSLQTSYYPESLLARAPRLLSPGSIEEGTVAYLRECGIQQVGYRDAIEVRGPDQTETDFFGLPPDARIQVFEIFRTAFAQDGEHFRLTITAYRADRNRFVIDVGSVPEPEKSATAETAPEAVPAVADPGAGD